MFTKFDTLIYEDAQKKVVGLLHLGVLLLNKTWNWL